MGVGGAIKSSKLRSSVMRLSRILGCFLKAFFGLLLEPFFRFTFGFCHCLGAVLGPAISYLARLHVARLRSGTAVVAPRAGRGLSRGLGRGWLALGKRYA